MFKWFKRHKCPKKESMVKLKNQNELLKEEVIYETKRRQLAEWNLRLAAARHDVGMSDYV